jgi:hypothetical protein
MTLQSIKDVMPIEMQKLNPSNKDSEMMRCASEVYEKSLFARNMLKIKGLASKEAKVKQVTDSVTIFSEVFVEIGFLTGVSIAVGSLTKKAFEEKLSEALDPAIRSCQAIQAKLNDMFDENNKISEECQFPNWDESGGTTLPGWSDQITRQRLITLIHTSVMKLMKNEIGPFALGKSGSTESEITNVMYNLFRIKFMCGVILGLYHCGPEQFEKIVVKNPDGKPVDLIPQVGRIPKALDQYKVEEKLAKMVGTKFS